MATLIIAFLLLFQMHRPNEDAVHPDIHIRLSRDEMMKIGHTPNIVDQGNLEADLIKQHQPLGKPSPACPSTPGYQGRHQFSSELTYSWETPRCK